MSSAATNTVMVMLESLPENVQERVVEHLRDYIENTREEMQWDKTFEQSQDKLAAAAQKARAEIARGLATPLNPDDL